MKRADVFFVGVIAQSQASGEIILLGYNTGGGWAFTMQTILCVGVWVSTGLPSACVCVCVCVCVQGVYIYI